MIPSPPHNYWALPEEVADMMHTRAEDGPAARPDVRVCWAFVPEPVWLDDSYTRLLLDSSTRRWTAGQRYDGWSVERVETS